MEGEINEMFSKIYQRYDLMNHILSFNFDKSWRDEAARDSMIAKEHYSILDVAAGTGDLSITINKMASKRGKKVYIYAYDFNKDMLAVAKEKFKRENMHNVKIEVGNAFSLKHKSRSLDVVTSGFALRSFFFSKGGKRNLQRFISESYRVLKPNGRIVLLDMAMPDGKSQRAFFRAYSYAMLAMGSFVDLDTYAWLVRTIKTFDKKQLVRMIESTGFSNVKIRSLRSGIAYIVTAEK
jgi:demethylmenaquinone methyltransferase / 2-methoxy-6-polyprenyl-1,4-benzoquinol methylase